MNGSSLLSEEGERGSFRLHPVIREYVRRDADRTARGVCQDIALRAVFETVVQEEAEESCRAGSSEEVIVRAVLSVAGHAAAVVLDQVDARELGQTEEQKLWK